MSNLQTYLYFYLLAILVLLLSLININSYFFLPETNILGVKTKNTEGIFWYDFLHKHPNYVPGWIEIGRTDKAVEIDPNYF